MRILLLSDIHANIEALEASLAAAPPYDLVANLGDIVGYGASPNEVTERSRQLGGVFVRGNHDKACTGQEGIEYFNPVAAAAALWTQQTLTPDNFQFLRGLTPGPVPLAEAQSPALDGDDERSREMPVVCVHGSPLDEDEYLITLQDSLEVMMRSSVRLIFFGHTHVQGGFSLGLKHGAVALTPSYATRMEAEHLDFELEPNAKYLINPGSVGQPRDGDWRSAFLLFDTEQYGVTFYRVPYDVDGAMKRIFDANLPDRLALRLKEGR